MDLIQTYSMLADLEHLARKWATKLPKHLTWLNLQTQNSAAKTRISCIACPYSGWCTSLPSNALIMSSASPSNTISKMPTPKQTTTPFYRQELPPLLLMLGVEHAQPKIQSPFHRSHEWQPLNPLPPHQRRHLHQNWFYNDWGWEASI